jgi:hypothetical protein
MSSILPPGKKVSDEELIKNRIELLRVADEVFRKHSKRIPTMGEYLNDILNLGKNIDLYVAALEPPEQILWKTKYSKLFSFIFPAIDKYRDYLGIMVRILILDETNLYTPELIAHLLILMIGDELMRKGIFTQEKAEHIANVFLNLLNIMREFFRRRNLCLMALSGSTEGLSIDELIASDKKGAATFLFQWLASDLIEHDDDMRGIYILATQERHVAAILNRSDTIAKLDRILETVETQMALNASKKEEMIAAFAAAKNAAAAAEAAAAAAAEKAAENLLKENSNERTAAAGKAAKEKAKKARKAAEKAAEKAEADRIAAAAAAAEKAEAERIAAERKAAQNAVKKSANLLAASMKKRAPELMTVPRTPLVLIKKPPSASPPAPSPASLPSSTSPTNSASPPLPPAPVPSILPLPPSVSPPNFSNAPRVPTPSLAKTGFTPYSRPPPVTRFWETLDHAYIYRLLYDLFIRTDNPDVRFYLKGSAAIHMYKRAARTAITNHTSDYDTTLLINPGLAKTHFYNVRSYMLNIIVNRLADAIDDPRFNAEVITKLHGAGIPFASFAYFNVTKREPVYAIQDKIPHEYVSVPDKSSPKFYSDGENHFPYASFAAKPSTNVLNLRILRALERPKNVTVLQLYTKTSPEIKLIEVTIPFYEYDETETQISLADQWKAADRINILDGIPVLSLPALKAEQQKLRTLKDAAEIDRRIADIDTLMRAAGGAGSARRRTRKRR